MNVVYEKYKDEGVILYFLLVLLYHSNISCSYKVCGCKFVVGLEILAFPCNQFGSQEPGTNEEIKETVCTRFKAEFPIFDKVITAT